MIRESTDKEGGREVVGRSGGEERAYSGMRHDLEKTKGRGGDFVAGSGKMDGLRVPSRAHHDLKMDHKVDGKGPFHKVGDGPSTRR